MHLFLTETTALACTVGGIFMKLWTGLSRPGPGLLVYRCFAGGASLQSLAMRKAQHVREAEVDLMADAFAGACFAAPGERELQNA